MGEYIPDVAAAKCSLGTVFVSEKKKTGIGPQEFVTFHIFAFCIVQGQLSSISISYLACGHTWLLLQLYTGSVACSWVSYV